MYTNINIQGSDHKFQYVIEYGDSIKSTSVGWKYIGCGRKLCEDDLVMDKVVFYNKDVKYYRCENHWAKFDDIGVNRYIPKTYNTTSITLYYPQHSIETYRTGVEYALSLYTWIHGKKIVLGTFILNRLDSCATSKIMRFEDQEYVECDTVVIIDPYELTYSDLWKDFRYNVCGEVNETNATGSILYASLHPVEFSEGEFMMVDEYSGGQNSILISTKPSDFLNLSIKTNIENKLQNDEPSIVCSLDFNDVYGGMLGDYLKETYGIMEYDIKWGVVIMDAENIYKCPDEVINKETTYVFDRDALKFENWLGWKEGLYIQASVEIMVDDDTLLCVMSNKIPLTQNIFKYFVGDVFKARGKEIQFVNLDEVNMNVYNINAVNKIENKIVQMNRVGDSRSNIVQSVFYRVSEVSDIILHPEVTETICINLDAYKALVDTFMIKIEGTSFNEIGRTSAGILFKITGNKLPKELNSGTYYILNQDSELVTTGKYTYVK